MLSAGCSVAALAAFVGGAVLPADGVAIKAGALAGFVKVCVPLVTSAEVASWAARLVAPIDLKLTATATPASISGSQHATVVAQVSFLGAGPLCGEFAGATTETLVNKTLGPEIVKSLLTKNVFMRQLSGIFAKFGENVYQQLLSSVSDTVDQCRWIVGRPGQVRWQRMPEPHRR